MYCLDGQGDEYVNVTFHENWLTCWATFHKYGTGIIDSDSVKHGAGGQSINWKLAEYLRTGPDRSATTDDTLTCNRLNNSRDPMMWYLRCKDAATRVGPACRRRKCSMRMRSFVTVWFAGRMIR